MKHFTILFFAAVAYGAVLIRQAPPPIPPAKGSGSIGDVVGGALQAAGSATTNAAQGMTGPRVPPAKGSGSIGDVVGGALQTAGSAANGAAQGMTGLGPAADLPKGVTESVGSGLSSAGQSAKGPKRMRRQAVGDVEDILGGMGDS